MTEQEQDEVARASDLPPEIEEESVLGCRTCGVGCLGILALVGASLGFLSANAGARLDAKVSEVSLEIQDLQDEAAKRRATLLGAPANDQNALADYNGFCWVLATGRPDDLPISWREARPQLPEDVDAMTRQVAPTGQGMDPVEPAYLTPVLEPHFDLATLDPSTKKRFQAAQKSFRRFRPLLRYVRDGLKRGRCDWQVDWEKGASLELPNLLQLRAAANLLAYEASLQPPREAIETGLEIVAFGEDCAHHGTLIGGMIGIALSQIGFQSLARTLERPGLEVHDYQRVIEALARFEPPTVEALLRGERVMVTVTLLQLGDRSLDQTTAEEASSNLAGFGDAQTQLLGLDATQVRELEGYERFHAQALELVRLPLAERRQRAAEFEAQMEEEHYLVASQLFVNADQCAQQIELSAGMARVVRALAAAHQVRIQRGAFPQSVQALAGALGEGLTDPTSNTGAPLGYAVHPPYVRCWLAGANGLDDGGPRLKRPRPVWVKKKKASKKKWPKGKGPRPKAPVIGGGGDDVGLQSMPPSAPAPAKPAAPEAR